jgi:DNA-binding CsgD family transcriptional regulator
MARLTGSDYRVALDLLRHAGAVEGPDPFPEDVLVRHRQLVPCDVVAYHEGNAGDPALVFTGEPRGEMTAAVRAAHRRYWDEDPLAPAPGARKYSDFYSRRRFHELGIYTEVSRPLGVEDRFRLWLAPGGEGNARLEFDRGDRNFRERDRDVLDLLRPHLEQLRRRATERRSNGLASVRAARLTGREREVLELVAEGRTNAQVARALCISPGTVRKHLENAFDKLDVNTRTAAVAALRAKDFSGR